LSPQRISERHCP